MRPDPFQEARGLGQGWVGPEHFLLALLAEPSVATEVLNGLGVTHDGLAEDLRAMEHHPVRAPTYDPAQGLSPSPAGYQLMGWAHGLAAGWGCAEPAAEHWLVAMIYDDGTVASLLHQRGATQQVVLAALQERGVRVPEVDPPWHKPWRGNEEVELNEADLDIVLALLTERHPPGSEWRWGFNWLRVEEPKRAVVDVEEGIDLDAIVKEALAGWQPSS